MAQQRLPKASRSRADALSIAKDGRAFADSARPMRPDKLAPLSTRQVVGNGLVHVLLAVHYAVSGRIGSNALSLSPEIITMDTGSVPQIEPPERLGEVCDRGRGNPQAWGRQCPCPKDRKHGTNHHPTR